MGKKTIKKTENSKIVSFFTGILVLTLGVLWWIIRKFMPKSNQTTMPQTPDQAIDKAKDKAAQEKQQAVVDFVQKTSEASQKTTGTASQIASEIDKESEK